MGFPYDIRLTTSRCAFYRFTPTSYMQHSQGEFPMTTSPLVLICRTGYHSFCLHEITLQYYGSWSDGLISRGKFVKNFAFPLWTEFLLFSIMSFVICTLPAVTFASGQPPCRRQYYWLNQQWIDDAFGLWILLTLITYTLCGIAPSPTDARTD